LSEEEWNCREVKSTPKKKSKAAQAARMSAAPSMVGTMVRNAVFCVGVGGALFALQKVLEEPKYDVVKAREALLPYADGKVATALALDPELFKQIAELVKFRDVAPAELNNVLITSAIAALYAHAIKTGKTELSRKTPKKFFDIVIEANQALLMFRNAVQRSSSRNILYFEFGHAIKEALEYWLSMFQNACIDAEELALRNAHLHLRPTKISATDGGTVPPATAPFPAASTAASTVATTPPA
jgi:hypothetical protein